MRVEEKGFTLIESMVAMMIVSVGLLAMASLLITAIKVNQDSELRMDASAKADAIVNYAITQVRANVDVYTADLQAVADTMAVAPFTPSVVLTTSPTVNCIYNNITVQVGWTLRGVTKSVIVNSGAMTNVGGC